MFDTFYIQDIKNLEEARKKSRTRYLWVLDRTNDYSNFDLLWEPVPWESNQIHVWPSQHQENGCTWLVPKLPTDLVNYHSAIVPRTQSVSVILVDHGNAETDAVYNQVKDNCIQRTRFINDYLGTLKRIISRIDSEYVWICSSVCDYSNFDFTWHPSEWQAEMLHVFPSAEQKFGDTFYIHVPTFKKKLEKLELLEWYETIHFVKDISVPRWSPPAITADGNSIVEAVRSHTFLEPLTVFNTENITDVPAVNLWREKTRTITPLSKGSSVIIVPRDAKTYLFKELYDYPYIDTTYKDMYQDKPLDVVFISNGEKVAEKNWEHLKHIMQDKPNRLVRSNGVNGRVEAYQAALRMSETPWAFCVFAKLTVDPDFDWSWQPDRMQKNKHYIFHARNPINGLEYGHMAMIAYHRDLTLRNKAQGLDFTLDQEHEVVPVLSGVANYADDPWTAWRSAFREAIKLKDAEPTMDTEYRLKQWLTKGEGKIGEWSKQGAVDGVAYYESVNGDFEELRKTYEWKWLSEYFTSVHDVKHDQL